MDANILYYVKISDFEGLDHSEGQGCTRDTKLESGQYAGGPCLSGALLNQLLLKKNFLNIKEPLQLDANMLYYVKINDFEGFDPCVEPGCTQDTKLESGQYPGGTLSK